MSIASRGATMAVDWEQRVNFDRLRSHRLQRTKATLEASELGSLLLFDPNNLRYVTSTAIGTWERDKNIRFALVPRGADPVLWDFGSAAKHHQLYCPWLPESSWRAWVPPMRGAMPDSTGIPDALATMVFEELRARGLEKEPVGMDVPDMTTLLALQRQGLHIVDSQPVMLEARKIKSEDELALLDQAAGIVDAAYETIYRTLRPGVTENEVVAAAMKTLFELGSEHVEAINAISGDRCNPHPHTFADRLLRPGDQAFFDIIHSFMGYRTCYYRTFNVGYATPSQLDAYKRCRQWLDDAIDLVRPGVTTDEIASVWPTAKDLGMADERAAFGLQFGHGLGVGLYEFPMISRLHSLDAPVELEVGMVFALETYCPASDGRSAARIEEEVIVTPTGPKVITRFPADELLVTGTTYVRGADFAPPRTASLDSANGSGGGAIAAPAAPPVDVGVS
jgi:Xaa-Pro aminopeptidase